jgi:uncharacterized protein
VKMTEVRFAAGTPIDGYGPGLFRIGGYQHMGGLLILPRRVAQWTPAWPLTAGCVADILAAATDIDIVLIGMGADIAPLPREVRAAIEAAGPGVDAMATPAACGAFNVLLAEERRVAAALLPV